MDDESTAVTTRRVMAAPARLDCAPGLVTVTVPYVNRSALVAALVPPSGVLTLMATTPAAPGGDANVIEVGELNVLATKVGPKSTVEAPVNPVPVMVTAVPPAAGPA